MKREIILLTGILTLFLFLGIASAQPYLINPLSQIQQKSVNISNSSYNLDSFLNSSTTLTEVLFWDSSGKIYIFLEKNQNGEFVAQMFYSIDRKLVNSSDNGKNIWGIIYPNNTIVGYVDAELESNKFWGSLDPLSESWAVTNNFGLSMNGKYRDNYEITKTFLKTDLILNGSHDLDGDIFNAKFRIENIGPKIAFDITSYLSEVPIGWQLSSDEVSVPFIYPGDVTYRQVQITRDSQDSEVYFVSVGLNVDRTTSNIIEVPIFKWLLLVTLFSLVSVYFFYRRR